jgi:CxxC motif-containing protein
MTERKYTCIICPQGCEITVTLDGEEIVNIEGNTCQRGKTYVTEELTAPMRTLTTTVMSASGRPVPVRTSATVPKEKLFDCMKEINAVTAPKGVRRGDIIIDNVAGTGVSVVATADGE